MRRKTPIWTVSDRILVERIEEGDADALRELERRYGETLFTLANEALREADAADALVRAVFWEAVACGTAALAPSDSVEDWLVEVTRRHLARRTPPLLAELLHASAPRPWTHPGRPGDALPSPPPAG